MTRFRRHWALLLFLYVVLDFTDPSVPGVFFFDSGAVFVDVVVQLKSNEAREATPSLQPRAHLVRYSNDHDQVAKIRGLKRPIAPPRPARTHLKHDDSASFASSSPADSSPIPPLS